MKAKKQQVIAVVSFAGDEVRIVSGRVLPYRREILGASHVSIAGKSDAEAVEAVRSLVDELGIKKVGATVVVPSQLVITKNIEIPSRDPAEIREIVNLQAGRHTPYAREEIIVDYFDVGAFRQNYSKVLLVIIARSAVKKYIDLLERAGLHTCGVVVGAEIIAWALSKMLRFETGEYPVAVVHIDDQASDFIIVLRGKCIFVRSIPIGAKQIEGEKEKYRAKFVEEVRRSIEAYQSEDVERKPATLVLTGAITDTVGLETMFSDEIALSVKVLTYCNHMVCSNDIQQQIAVDKTVSYLPAAACLHAGAEQFTDISPEEVKVRRSLEKRAKDLIKAGLLITVIFALACVVLAVNLTVKGVYLRKVDTRYKELSRNVQDLEKDFSKIGMIRNYFTYQGYSLEVLSELSTTAPSDMQFADIRFDNELGKVSVRGTSDSMAAVFQFSENLEKSKYFKDVQVKNTSKRKDGEREVTDFELNSQLERTAVR